MTILVINAPRQMVRAQRKKSFAKTFSSRIGKGYAIWSRWFARCYPGCKVVLLSKDERKRAEGKLVKLVPVSKARNGIQRYDVYIRNLTKVTYRPEPLNRNGVLVRC